MEAKFEKDVTGIAKKNVQRVIEKWKVKKEEYREEWLENYWPAKYVSLEFKLAGKKYCFTPDTIGLEKGDCWDEGFMEFLEKYIIIDLQEIGATDFIRLGFLD